MEISIHQSRPKMGDLPLRCCKVDCTKPALFQPVLLLWAKNMPSYKRNDKNCLRMEIGLSLCSEHAKTIKAVDLISDEGWDQIGAIVNHVHIAEPDRSTACVELKPVPGLN